jgi:hypothetical protein
VNNNRGAASVLIVFLMLVLVTLGTFAIVSSNANWRLNQRALAWNTMYYAMDAEAEELLARIDRLLLQAEVKARGYLLQNDDISPEIADSINNSDNETDIFNIIYMHYADEWLTELSFIEEIDVNNFGDGFWVSYTVESEVDINEADNYLSVSLWLGQAPYVSKDAENIQVAWENGKRYAVSEWYQYPVVEFIGTPMEVWDGSLDFLDW